MFRESFRAHLGTSVIAYQKIYDLISEIPDSKIDLIESEVKTIGNFTLISLKSINNESCPIDIQLGFGREVSKLFVSLLGDIHVIYYEAVNSDLIDTLEAVLKSQIKRKDFSLSNGKVVKIIVTCSQIQYDNGDMIEFSLKLKSTWPWQNKYITDLSYIPWI